ncbi:DUF4142 domain-containing protein [Hymenobacter psoromatis]|uniref:DUF4142 domain-containing protein n=1 Tax=Hymenobacter psoromatis TaxID=1484116 RepID=UPI001CBE1754|nr:DUF4142 domain-containing protein [Hymenobacter psoromatis]
MNRFLLPLLGAALLALPACNSKTDTKGQGFSETTKPGTTTEEPAAVMPDGAQNPTDMPAAAGSAPAKGQPDPNGPTAPHANDAQFMQSAAHSDQNEMQLSKLALAKGVTGMTKTYAEKMIADHTKSTAALQPIAAKAGVTLPTDMDDQHKEIAQNMQQLSGKDLQDRYLEQMEADHQITANTLVAHQQMTKNAALSSWITQTLPVVTQHLGMAKADARETN